MLDIASLIFSPLGAVLIVVIIILFIAFITFFPAKDASSIPPASSHKSAQKTVYKCKDCNEEVRLGEGHTCTVTGRQYSQDDDSFVTSFFIANITDSAGLGMLVGGNPAGAMLGDFANTSEQNNQAEVEHYHHVDHSQNDGIDDTPDTPDTPDASETFESDSTSTSFD